MTTRHRRQFVFALLAALPLAQAQAPEEAILAPPPNSAHQAGGLVRFIGRGSGPVKLDGVPVTTKTLHEGVQTAELKPAKPGIHLLEFEGQTLRFLTADEATPGFAAFSPHPPAAQCETCHAVRNGRWRFQRVSLASVCSNCHAREAFQAKHTHEMTVLTDCQLCHNPHGSTTARPAHLKLDRDKACRQCHNLQ
jgi:predicted CXXCH cytochrome family protein